MTDRPTDRGVSLGPAARGRGGCCVLGVGVGRRAAEQANVGNVLEGPRRRVFLDAQGHLVTAALPTVP